MTISYDRKHDWTKYPFEVPFGRFVPDERCAEIRQWIKENVPGHTVLERPHDANGLNHTACFREEKHAMLFKMRWL